MRIQGKRTEQCSGLIYVPETMRYTGRGKTGFEMNYVQRQCRRRTKDESGFCWNCRLHRRHEKAE